jgi:tetratricopeptide (TPR) repeat protein
MTKTGIRGFIAAALIAGALATPVAWSQGAQPPPPKISPALAKPFKAAQDAQKAKRWPEVVAKAQEVLASKERKPDDTYYAYYLIFEAGRATNNNADVRKGLEGIVDSGFLTPPQQVTYLKALASMAFQAKEYDAAIDYGNRVIKAGIADTETQTYVGQSYYQKGNFAESAKSFDGLVNDQVKRGEKPREQYLKLLQASYNKLNNKNAETDVLEKLVVHYPNPTYWDQLLYSVRSNPSLEPRQKLWVYRLMSATNTLKQSTDYNRFAEYCQGAGLPAEAQRVYEAGLKANVFSGDEKARIERQVKALGTVAATDRAELPQLEAQARSAPNGDLDVTVGMALHSFGESGKAIEALQRGLQKGGLKEQLAVDGSLGLGLAQLRNKDSAAAQKTFQSIKSDDPNIQRIAKLWALYAK